MLIDQDKCRGWRLCISGCPYKKIYFNWKSGKSENVSSVIRELSQANPPCAQKPAWVASGIWGVLLYDADRIEEAAQAPSAKLTSYERQCEVFLDPHDPSVIEEALKQGIPQKRD